ncbi:MAG: hypothetical protein GX100_09310, partial [candidate division WS1 bacterium]|nr:hypothetical protein [candidate division WS1 bacterium]
MRSFSGYLVAVSCWLYVVVWGALGGPAAAENQVQLARQTYLRGEVVSVTVAGAREGLGLRLRGVTVPGSWNLALADDGSTRIDTAPYRVGDYALELRRGEETVESVGLYLRPAQRPEVWYGNFTSRPLSAGGDPYQELRDLGMNCAYLHGISPDEALRHGIYLVVHGNALRSVYTGLTDEQKRALGQVFMNCEGTTKAQDKVACMRNPEVIRMAGERVVESVQEMVGYPGVMGIGVDDEVGMHAYDWNDTGGVTCYCDSCRKLWKAKTGKEPPRPVCLPPGSIIPDKDPYLRYATEWTGWADYAGPAEADYNQAMVEKLHRVRPDWLVFQTPGGLYGEMDAVHWEIYSYWMSWPVTEALASMSYVRGHHQEKYGARKPIWPLLGWFQRTPAPEWTGNYIAAQVRMCMAEGAAGIWLTLMPWYDSGGRHKQAILAGMEHLAPAVRETGRMLEQYGPALIRITPTRYPVAVLRSRTTEMYQRVIDPKVIAAAKAEGSWTEVAWEHTQATGMGFGALLRAGA